MQLDYIQKIACVDITTILGTCPTAVLKALIDFSPLQIEFVVRIRRVKPTIKLIKGFRVL